MDRDLVERARSGDQEAFADLVHQVSDTLFGVARRILRDPGLAEDVLQAGGDACRTAVLVRSDGTRYSGDDWEFAFFPTEALDKVYVVQTGRGDAWPGAAKYGGSVQLLKSILAEGVTDAP